MMQIFLKRQRVASNPTVTKSLGAEEALNRPHPLVIFRVRLYQMLGILYCVT